MSSKSILTTGQRIMISSRARDGSVREYVSQVLEVLGPEKYSIAVPISKGLLVPVMNGTLIDILYIVEESGMYRFQAKVLSKTKAGNVPSMTIRQTGNLVKDQRRSHFRVSLLLPMKLHREGDFVMIEGSTKDLSGGGMRFISAVEFDEGDILWSDFMLDEQRFTLRMKVVRKFKSVEPGIFESAGEFLDITEVERNRIIGFLFQRQRIMMKTR
ncbi:MAG: PilZ domain-containing protein [Peptostreptococcaceae bacterium]|nr:PilZ domain-containing protein [Peptostreptococcaceae bacterium]